MNKILDSMQSAYLNMNYILINIQPFKEKFQKEMKITEHLTNRNAFYGKQNEGG